MVVRLDAHREQKQKRSPTPEAPPLLDDDEAEAATILSLEEREKALYLHQEGFWQDRRGLSIVRYRQQKQVLIPIFRGHIDALARRIVFDVPTRLEKAPEAQDMAFIMRASTLDRKEEQPITIFRSDMLARQPEYAGRLYTVPLPGARAMADFHHAIEILGFYRTVPVERVYNASGLLRVQDRLFFLNPAGGALTASGLDAEKRVQYPAQLAEKLAEVPYGWERASSPGEAAHDASILLQLLDIAPGAPGYGAILAGIAGFAPFSQVCTTGGVHAIVHGSSGSQKSSTARLVQQGYAATWGRDEISAINLRENASTPYAIEQIAHHLAGMFLLLDDGLKGNKVPEKDISAFYKLVSVYGAHAQARQGRSAGVWNQGKGGAAASFYPRGSSIITVETLPQSSKHTSELARFATITLDGEERINFSVLSALQERAAAQAMNRAIAAYICWLLDKMQVYLDGIEAREAFYRVPGVHLRTVTTYAKLETGLAALIDYAVSVGALSAEAGEALLTREREALKVACIAQQALIGRGEGTSKSNDAVKQFYFYLTKALRDGKLYLSDATRVSVPLVTEGTEQRHQPPACLGEMGYSKEEMGWRFREDMREGNGKYTPASGAHHLGVLRKRGEAPAEVKMLQRTFRDEAYPLIERLARADDATLPDYADMMERLKKAGKLIGPTENTWLQGRGSEKGRCFVLQWLDDESPDPGTGPEHDGPFVCGICGDETEEMYFSPDGQPRCASHQQTTADRPAEEQGPGNDRPAEEQGPGNDRPAEEQGPGNDRPAEEQGPGNDRPLTTPARQRVAAYLDVSTGRGILDDGRKLTGTPGADLARIVRALPADVTQLYLTGERPGGSGTLADMQQWIDAGEIALAPDWTQQKRGHWLPTRDNGNLEEEPVLRFQQQETGRKLDIRRMAAWLAEEHTPEEARAMRQALLSLLQETFGPSAYLMATPAQTGLEMWKRTVKWTDYPPLPEETQALIRSTSGQGRIELCPPDVPTLPALYYLDGIFMYGSLTNGLGNGPVQRDTLNEYAGYRPGRYRIRFTVPEGWAHVGLFPVKADDGETWDYPCTPGYTGETWVDGAELHAAYQAQERTGQSWHIEILERLLLTAPASGGHGPLYAWAQKLIGLRESLPDRVASGQLDERIAALVKSALRAMLLHTIGSFHRGARTVTRRTLDASQVPTNNPTVRKRGQFWTWEERETLGKAQAWFQHPEWSAAIYGRCRSRLLLHRQKIGTEEVWSGALTLPRESVVGFWTDAIMTSTLPAWADGKRPGQFKVKGSIQRKVKTPRTDEQVSRLRERMKTEGK